MTTYSDTFKKIKEDFQRRNVPIDTPGFYDHRNFLEVEQNNPEYLINYARFVHDRPRTDDYDQLVKSTTPIVAQAFYKKLKSNGRLGACVDISGVISRTLEAEGIFNFIVKGSLTIDFPKKSAITRKYFWSVDNGAFTAAHAWVVAPPFYIIDVSVQLQPFTDGESKYLPRLVCSEGQIGPSGLLEDVVAPEIRAYAMQRGVLAANVLDQVSPGTSSFMKLFPARTEKHKDTTLKFVPVAVTAPDSPFQDMVAIKFKGKTGYEVYEKEIKHALNKR